MKNFFSTSIDYVFTVDGKSKSKGSDGNIYLEEVREFEKMVDGKDSLIAKAKDGYNVVRVVEDAHKSIMEVSGRENAETFLGNFPAMFSRVSST